MLRTPAITLVAFAVAVAAGGCEARKSSPQSDNGDNVDAASPSQNMVGCAVKSGSRLQGVYYESPEGTRQFVEWFDSQKQQYCHFVQTPDQKFRCMPSDVFNSTLYFSDSACATEVAYGGANQSSCARQLLVFPDGIPNLDPLFRRLRYRPVAGPGSLRTEVYQKRNGVCEKVATSSGWYYPVGDDLPYGEFVEATLDDGTGAAGDGAGRIRTAHFAATDGATQRCVPTAPFGQSAALSLRFYDTARNEVCAIGTAADGKRRCLPPNWLSTSANGPFVDTACSQPTYVNAGAAKYVMQRRPETSAGSECRVATRFFERGAQVTTKTYVVDSAEKCVVNPFVEEAPLYARGPEVVPESFSDFTLTAAATTTGRLRAYVSAADGDNRFAGNYEDTQQNTMCRFGKTADDKLRCIPVAPYGIQFVSRYTDAACQTAPISVGIRPSGCARQEVRSIWRQGTCEGARGNVVVPRAGPLYQKVGTTCKPDTADEYLELGAAMDPAELVEGRIVVE